MLRRSPVLLLLGVGAGAVGLSAQGVHEPHAQGTARPARLGTVVFPASGSDSAHAQFLLGVLYLHSFEYQSAERAFRASQSLDPDFAMAYWGEAMTYTHPVWNEQDLSSARTALDRLAPTPEARQARAKTPRERAYLGAVEQLYGDGSKARRDTLYAAAMEQVVRAFPDDLEAKAFYALALLGLNQGIRDTTTYLKAARYADTVFRANPDHPGAAHYLIHAYDDPFHASLGLEAARAYSRIAPDAAHAQHMTTHVFLALGMWDDVVAQNRVALGLTAPIPGHYSSWLVYALIQQGRYDAARSMMEELRRNAAGVGQSPQFTALAEMRAHWLLHAEEWNSTISRWKLSRERMTTPGRLVEAFVEGVIAYRRNDVATVSQAARDVLALSGELREALGPGDPATLAGRVMARELGAMQLFLSGARESAIRALTDAAAIEDTRPLEFGPPQIVEPSHEILGTMLLEMAPSEALAHFQRALSLAPGRSRALIGLVRAAVATGDKPLARRSLEQLLANWRLADPNVRDAIGPLRRIVERMP